MARNDSSSDLDRMHRILRSDPRRYVDILTQRLGDDPDDAQAYFSRHMGWMALGEARRALDDINRSIQLDPDQIGLWSRGDIFRHLGEYEKAAADYERAEAIDPVRWTEYAFPLLYQADVHARRGDLPKALDCCARLPGDFWTPGLNDLPAGGKAEIADELRRRARSASAGWR